jgi:hypothetical protein
MANEIGTCETKRTAEGGLALLQSGMNNVAVIFEQEASDPYKDKHRPVAYHNNIPGLTEINTIKRTYIGLDGLYSAGAKNGSSRNIGEKCLNATGWLNQFAVQPSWSEFSQRDQDSVLYSLFSAEFLGTTNKYFVEFGFPGDFSTSTGNGRFLKNNLSFNKFLLLDGNQNNPQINLHKKFITAANIVSLFEEYKAPTEPDYVSIDIDSCDLWVFHALTKKYRPRVVTVEYNANYPLGDYTSLRCADPTAEGAYQWDFDNIYGASLSAIELAGRSHGYSLVYVTPGMDAFLVRDDLLCPGTRVAIEKFKGSTGLRVNGNYTGKQGPRSELLTNFSNWLARDIASSHSVDASSE